MDRLREDAQTSNHCVLVHSELKPPGIAILTNERGLRVEQSDARSRSSTQVRCAPLCREPAREAVDPVPIERGLNLLQVVALDLLGVVELVVVHQLAEALDGGSHLGCGGRARKGRLVTARVEPGGHRSERPDTEARLHALEPNLRGLTESNCLFTLDSERQIRER